MKIVAFDQATRVTGFAMLRDGKLVDHGLIKAKANLDIVPRMYYITDTITDYLCIAKPDVVCFEGVEGVKNEATMMHLANLQGMCLLTTHRLGLDTRIVDVAKWRHTLGFTMGRGVMRSDLKAQAIAYVAKHFGMECGDDEAEAICIAVAMSKILDSKE